MPALAGTLVASPIPDAAAAQISVEAAVQTDYRLRGYSVSGGKPAGSISIEYDHPSGFYAGGVGAGTIDDGDPALVLLEGHAGYALRIGRTLSVDLGASQSRYFSPHDGGREYGYSEFYLGIGAPNVSARISYSPDHSYDNRPVLYAEANAGIEPASNWTLSAHVGALIPFNEIPYYRRGTRYDWRLGASRALGAFSVHLELSGRSRDAFYGSPSGPAAVLILTRAF